MADVRTRANLEEIVKQFYDDVLDDPIIGFIFNDVAAIDLKAHLPVVVDFWEDALFLDHNGTARRYHGNTLKVHLELAEKISLRPGHFTRWLYLFNRSVDQFSGSNAAKMKQRADSVAKSISAALTAGRRRDMQLTLDDQD